MQRIKVLDKRSGDVLLYIKSDLKTFCRLDLGPASPVEQIEVIFPFPVVDLHWGRGGTVHAILSNDEIRKRTYGGDSGAIWTTVK